MAKNDFSGFGSANTRIATLGPNEGYKYRVLHLGVDADDLMAEGRSDTDGYFYLTGNTQEFTPIDPKFNIYHDCEDSIMVSGFPTSSVSFKPCQRKISIMIPDEYISQDETPKKIYDAGTIQLSGEFTGEERDCIH